MIYEIRGIYICDKIDSCQGSLAAFWNCYLFTDSLNILRKHAFITKIL
jgi:hypothetical protein